MAIRLSRLENGGLMIYDASPDSSDKVELSKVDVHELQNKLTAYINKGQIRNKATR